MVRALHRKRVVRGGVYVGPSGFSYPGWQRYLPVELAPSQRLHYLSRLFNAIEINGSFYKQIEPRVYAEWRRATPAGFRFALKGHRFVTHYRRLRDCAEPIDRLRRQSAGLGAKLAVVLWQLPANATVNLERLDHFLSGLRRGFSEARHAFELRHPSWFRDDVRALLERAGAAVCIADAPDFPRWDAVTTDLVYVRLHGHTRKYASSYSSAHLGRWAEKVAGWRDAGFDVHVYFDNDAEGAALTDATTLAGLVGIEPAGSVAAPRRLRARARPA